MSSDFDVPLKARGSNNRIASFCRCAPTWLLDLDLVNMPGYNIPNADEKQYRTRMRITKMGQELGRIFSHWEVKCSCFVDCATPVETGRQIVGYENVKVTGWWLRDNCCVKVTRVETISKYSQSMCTHFFGFMGTSHSCSQCHVKSNLLFKLTASERAKMILTSSGKIRTSSDRRSERQFTHNRMRRCLMTRYHPQGGTSIVCQNEKIVGNHLSKRLGLNVGRKIELWAKRYCG